MENKKNRDVQEQMETTKSFNESDIKQLKKTLNGNVYLPNNKKYEKAKKSWALTVEHKPALIIEVKNTADVISAVHFANKHNLYIAVQSTGHGASRPCIGHMLIKTNLMKEFSIDVNTQTLTTDAGATWDSIIKVSQEYGLALPTGFLSTVGVTGFILGGGFGWLVRKHGVAVDHLVSVKMVNLEGEEMTVSATEHPELFWGLCGGGGNFGIVTSLTLKLLPVKEVFTSEFYFNSAKARQVMEVYRTITKTFPEELTSMLAIKHLPPIPVISKTLREMFVVAVKAVYLGDKDKGEQLLAPLKELKPIYKKHEMMSYEKVGKFSGDPEQPGKVYGHVEIINEFTEGLADVLSNLISESDSVIPVIEIRHVEGAMAKVAAGTNSFAHRDGKFIMQVEIPLAAEATQAAAADYANSFAKYVKPYVTGGRYLNFIGNVDTGEEVVKAAFREEDFARLRRLKRQYDPGNILRFNYNIPPAKV